MKRVLIVIVLLVVYGSLFPFRLELPAITVSPLEYLLNRWDLPNNSYLPHDVLVNIVLYFPLGLAAHFVFTEAPLVGPVLLAAALSFSIEFSQIWEPGREPSMVDLMANTAGATLGVAAGVFLRSVRLPRLASRFPPEAAWAAVAAFAVFRLSPFEFQTSPLAWDWVPFDRLLRGRADAGLAILGIKIAGYAGLALMLRLSRRSAVTTVAALAAVAAATEAARLWLPFSPQGFTEPVIAALASFVVVSLVPVSPSPGTETQSR